MATAFRILRPVRTVEEEAEWQGPGLAAGSVLGCAYGRAHHCHWLWWDEAGEIGRYCCRACQPELWAEIPKASLNDMRLKG